MSDKKEIIIIIDDDASVRRNISLLLKSADYEVESFSSAEEFLKKEYDDTTGCIILDVHLEGKSGLELQEELSSKAYQLPIIFITGKGDIPMSVQALKKGAVDFLPKPFDDGQLFKAIEEALIKSRRIKAEHDELKRVQVLVDSLTPRELEVFKIVITGMLNKQIAYNLNIAEHTVKLHRKKITEKLGVKSVAEMVQLAQTVGTLLPKSDD
jgi:FixJ family two-component response regulator